MARQRRGGGFRPPELRGTLGTLLRTTLEQAGAVRDALGRAADTGRSRLDDALSHRRRKDALAELGELVLDLIRRGEIDLAELPEAQDLVRYLDELDAEAADEPEDRPAPPSTRRRFDARPPSRHADRSDHDDRDDDRDGTVSALRGASPSGGYRGPATSGSSRGPRGADSDSSRSSRGASDSSRSSRGASDSGRWSPPRSAAPPRVWRPTAVDDEPPADPHDTRDAARGSRSLPRDPHRKGGIQFDDDEDLADYMHPDDVPPKPPADDDR